MSQPGLTCGRPLSYTGFMSGISASQWLTRVLLLSDESPLSLGAEAMLRDETALEVIRELDPDRVVECIRTFHPDAVVLGLADKTGESASEWLHLLSSVPDIRLIALSVQDNNLRIYERGQVHLLPDASGLLVACRAPQG